MEIVRRLTGRKSARRKPTNGRLLPMEVMHDVFALLGRRYTESVLALVSRYFRDTVAALPTRPYLLVHRISFADDEVSLAWGAGVNAPSAIMDYTRFERLMLRVMPAYLRIQNVDVTMIADTETALAFYADNERMFDALKSAWINCANSQFTVRVSTLFGRPASVCATFERLMSDVALVPTIVIDERGFDPSPDEDGARKHPGVLFDLPAVRQCRTLTILSYQVDMALLGPAQYAAAWLHDTPALYAPTPISPFPVAVRGDSERSFRFELTEPWSERELPMEYRQYVRDVTALIVERFEDCRTACSFSLKLGNYSFKSATAISTTERILHNDRTNEFLQIHEANSVEFQHLAVSAIRRRAVS